MAQIAVVPVFHETILKTRLAGRTLLGRVVEKLYQIRELDRAVFVAPVALTGELRNQLPKDFGEIMVRAEQCVPMMGLRSQFADKGNATDRYVFCNPFYPFVPREKIEQAVMGVMGEFSSVVTTGLPYGAFNWKNGSGRALLAPVGLDACVAIKGNVTLSLPENVWYFGDRVQYISLNDVESVCVRTEAGMKLADAVAMVGER